MTAKIIGLSVLVVAMFLIGTEEEAYQARLAGERKYFGEFSRNNFRVEGKR